MKSAIMDGAYIIDNTFNGEKKSYFSTMLNIQNSFNRIYHGNFVPYKKINVDYNELGKSSFITTKTF